MKPEFDDIRAYQDHEVNDMLMSLLKDSEFLQFIAMQKFPRLQRFFPALIQSRIKKSLKSQFKHVHSIQSMQNKLAPFVQSMMDKTVTQFNVTGLDNLHKDKAYVFMSNHRDIAMDPMLVNYALLNAGLHTCKIAIGDNLIERPFVNKLMRLNKSFVVRRKLEGRKEKLEAVNHLSNYIHHSLKSNQSIWIAQKEGRAKDGKDVTDKAVLKMLHMAGRKLGWDFNESMNFLNLVPVTISYEWDPCDEDKAKELDALKQHGHYEKAQDEDFHSIVKGIKGHKGQVSIHFSKPIKLDSIVPEQWSQEMDNSIHQNYHIYDNNQQAQKILESENSADALANSIWSKKYAHLSSSALEQIVNTYAQPVVLKKAAQSS
jgi:glycerol-3-phosphate O-acyltransferase